MVLSVKWYSFVVLLCISLMANNVEHLFMCLMVICVSSLESYLFRSIIHLLLDNLPFLLSCNSDLYILDTNLLLDK